MSERVHLYSCSAHIVHRQDCPDCRLAKAAPKLLESCQDSVILINEVTKRMDAILAEINRICPTWNLPPFPRPPIQGIKDAILEAGGTVYETAQEVPAAIAGP